MKRKLGTLADWTCKDQKSGDGQQARCQWCHPHSGLGQLQVVESTSDEKDQENPRQETDIANTCDHECLHTTSRVILTLCLILGHGARSLHVVPEANEGIAAHTDNLPADKGQQEIVCHYQKDHACNKELHEEVIAGETWVFHKIARFIMTGHVSHTEENNERTNAARNAGHKYTQGVDENAELD